MKTRLAGCLLAVLLLSLTYAPPARGQAEVQLPEFTVTDMGGVLLGAYAGASDRVTGGAAYVRVLRQDTINNENYLLFVGPDHLQGLDDDDVWYSMADCTGTPYVKWPGDFHELPGLRGSVYAVGRKSGATDEDSVIVRGAISGMMDTDTGKLNSRYRTNIGSAPTCSSGGSVFPPTNFVEATEVADLSALVRPFKVQ